jgi:PD-(D/E)XK endonuclease
MSKPRGARHGRIPASEESCARNPAKQGELGEAAFLHKATSLGFALALPYGHVRPYDFIVESGRNLWRVQVKTVAYVRAGLYYTSIRRRNHRKMESYTESEIDFVAVYIVPEETWYILPVREVVERRALLFRPKGYPHSDIYAHYREAWQLLREPDGLTFG